MLAPSFSMYSSMRVTTVFIRSFFESRMCLLQAQLLRCQHLYFFVLVKQVNGVPVGRDVV